MELSVVLISKNQAWNIARLVESVLRGTSSIPASEIILVDSASTDDTVQLASRYPINIVRLRPTQKLSPAAGRYIGYKRTRGEFILFLDGDMELIPGWLCRPFAPCEARPMPASCTPAASLSCLQVQAEAASRGGSPRPCAPLRLRIAPAQAGAALSSFASNARRRSRSACLLFNSSRCS